MYSSDITNTLLRYVKDYDKNIVFRDCQMHFLNIYLRRKDIFLISFRHFVVPKINGYWATFETLAEIERDCKERQLNSTWAIADDRRKCSLT